MEDPVYLDDRDALTVVRSMEADLKALIALSAATLRVLEAALPAKFHGADGVLKNEADIAAKADPASAAHIRALLEQLSHRLSPKRAPTQGLSELEWAQIDPPAKTSKG